MALEFASGAMGSLIPKLGELLQSEYNLKKTVNKGIRDLKAELEMMQASLEKVSEVPLDKLHSRVKIWANEVRELSYAIEDSLDSSMVPMEGLQITQPHTFKGFIRKTRNKVSKFKIRHQIADDLKDIKIQVREVKERYDRYNIGDVVAKLTTTTVDPRLSTMYNTVSNLVGVDKAIDELTERLSEGNDPSGKKLKAVSIVGFGGLGKTTLAKAVYDKLKKDFSCGAFIPVGQNPDKKQVLRDMLLELDIGLYKDAATMDERQLIDQLRNFLADKRYLIVIDDMWDTQTWDVIKWALVNDDNGSRIITTTRNLDVAEKVGDVYKIKPLSDDNSKMLFRARIFGAEGITSDVQTAKISDKFLKKCGGIPLAIITIASLLVSKRWEDWSKVYDSIGFGNEDSEVVKDARTILSFSFYDLPCYLKTCLLHLSMFPEDRLIMKRELIWMWIAEGFVPCQRGKGSFEVGESYFSELVNKSMIQLIESSDSAYDACRVHDMMLDVIRNLSSELRFVTVHGLEQEQSTCPPSRSDSVRRLAIHKRSAEHSPMSMEMGRVRSYSATLCTDSRLLQLLSFKVLRVLVFDHCYFAAEECRLEHLEKLVLLRYLGLTNTRIMKLPVNIGHCLKLLQMLDVRASGIRDLPASAGELSKLMCIRTTRETRMMGGIGNLTSLEELELCRADECPNFFADLGRLKEVRVLRIHLDEMDEDTNKALVKSLSNLCKMQILGVSLTMNDLVHAGSWEDLKPSSELREFTLQGQLVLARPPSWMNISCVPYLSHLSFRVEMVEAPDFQMLGKLQSLRFLYLMGNVDNCLLVYTVGTGEFEKLRCLETNIIEIICGGEGGVLPMIEKLKCRACVETRKDVDVGGLVPGDMPLLQEVTYQLDCKNWSPTEVDKAETVLWHANKINPSRPAMKIRRENYKEELLVQHFTNLFSELDQKASAFAKEEFPLPSHGVTGEFGKPGVRGRRDQRSHSDSILRLIGRHNQLYKSGIAGPSGISGDSSSRSQEVVAGPRSGMAMPLQIPADMRAMVEQKLTGLLSTISNCPAFHSILSNLAVEVGISPDSLWNVMEEFVRDPAFINAAIDMALSGMVFTADDNYYAPMRELVSRMPLLHLVQPLPRNSDDTSTIDSEADAKAQMLFAVDMLLKPKQSISRTDEEQKSDDSEEVSSVDEEEEEEYDEDEDGRSEKEPTGTDQESQDDRAEKIPHVTVKLAGPATQP
ncbi:hypothetical protein ZWY2020_037612 [Hordeum vulgare]|nr:hypothetical protein ZWY2020_037612 [Hordeum vulgare]